MVALLFDRLNLAYWNLANLHPPLRRAGVVHRGATGIHRHRHRHVLDLELVDRLHAQVAKPTTLDALIALDTR